MFKTFAAAVDWTPLKNRVDIFGGARPSDEYVWQFGTFLQS